LIYNAQNRIVTNAVCDQAVGSITGITTNATIFEWRNGSGVLVSRELDLLNQPPAFYTLTLRNGFGCQEVLEPFHIQNRSTAISIFQSETIVADNCGLGRGRITGITHNADGPRYSWKNEAGVVVGTARDLIDVRAGIYELTITNRGGCTEARTYQVTDVATVLAAPIIEDQFVCSPIGITISFNANADIYRIYDANGALLQESTAKTFKLDISNTVTYYAAVARGTCESTRTPFTITLGQAAVNIPTSFSPNNDGVNDFWVLKGIEIYNAANIKIFNRYGTIVYESTSNGSKPFDGKSKGADLPAGVYFYIIKLTSECDPFTGSVTILR
ncbi:MAG: gliding motility-associated C-terminal domain-containing protein, partial [Pedobacter sp.]